MLDFLMRDPLGFLQYLIYRAPAVLLAIILHEYAHGYVAYRAGDPTAKMMGRLSLNPLSHLDLVGTLCLVFFGFGWAKPVPVNPSYFRRGRRDELKVALAGVTVNFMMFILATVVSYSFISLLFWPAVSMLVGKIPLLSFRSDYYLMQILPSAQQHLSTVLKTPALLHVQRFLLHFATVNLGMFVFNLLPVPPLDGFHVLNDTLLRGKVRLNANVFRALQAGLFLIMFATNVVSDIVLFVMQHIQLGVLNVVALVLG